MSGTIGRFYLFVALVQFLLWLPNLQTITSYNRHDGWTQNQRGEVFNSSRSSLFLGNAVVARVMNPLVRVGIEITASLVIKPRRLRAFAR